MCDQEPLQFHKGRRRERFASAYHLVAAVLILLCGLALFAIGIWLRATDNGVPLNLHYAGDNWHPLFLNFGAGFIVLGAFLLFTVSLALLSFSNRGSGRLFRVLYVALALAIVAALLAGCIVSSLLAARMWTTRTRATVRAAWDLSARMQPNVLCDIESRFRCRGLEDGECVKCRLGREPACDESIACVVCGRGDLVDIDTGCYDQIAGAVRRIFVPIASITGVVAAVVFADVFVSYFL